MSCFGEYEQIMVIYHHQQLTFVPLPIDITKRERLLQLAHSVTQTQTIRSGSLFTGVGCCEVGLSKGLHDAGLATKWCVANEINPTFIDAITNNHPSYKADDTTTIAMDINQLDRTMLPSVDIWTAGIVCKSFSSLNTASRDAPEWDTDFGHLTISTLLTLGQTGFNAPMVFIENVVPYFTSLSFHQLKTIMHIKGYTMHVAGDFTHSGRYTGVASGQYGDIENRRRMYCLFATEGVNIDLSLMDQYHTTNTTPISRLLDSNIDNKAYNIGKGLKTKSQRTGWKNKVVTDKSCEITTVSAGYGKVRAEDPKLLKHNEDITGDFRLFTPAEIARFKTLPAQLVDGINSKRDAYTALGNGLTGNATRAFFYAVAKSLTTVAQPWDKLRSAA